MIYYDQEATDKILSGVEKLCKAVAVTLGPKGRNVLLSNKETGFRMITNDGITIAKHFHLEDTLENEAAEIAKEAAHRTNKEAGDGTTTTIILVNAFLKAGFDLIKSGKNPMEVRTLMELSADKIISNLSSHITKVETVEDLEKVAYISSENKQIAKLISELMCKLGLKGVVDIEEVESNSITSEIKTGFDFDGVMVSPYLEKEMSENVPVLVVDYKLRNRNEVAKLCEKIVKNGDNRLAIICDDIDNDVLSFLALNNQKNVFHTLVCKVESFVKFEHLQDVAALCGTKIYSKDSGIALGDIEPSDLGTADKITLPIIQDAIAKTKIIRANAKLYEHIAYLETQTLTAFDKERMARRIAKLKGGVASILVGAPSKSEREYLKLKIEDAVNSVRSAMEDGVVDGGGVALFRTAKNADFLSEAVKVPFHTIFVNVGIPLIYADTGAYDARENKWVDNPFSAGIIDSFKVVKNAVKNASSVAGILLTTSVSIIE